MSTFDDDERSVSRNRPIDLYTIVTPTTEYLLTSYPVNVTYAGIVYTALTMSRGDQQVTQDPTGRELLVYLPITHPLVQRFAASGIPEHSVRVILQRLQTVSGAATQYFDGFATGLNVQDHVAAIRCPSVVDDALKIKLPVIRAQKTCNHVLFDDRCSPAPGLGDGPVASNFTAATTAVSQTITPGTVTMVVASIAGNPDGYFDFGRMHHVSSGQDAVILQQIGTSLLINIPIVGLNPGDDLKITGGCAHDVVTCKTKFANVKNFGGLPNMDSTFAPYSAGAGLSAVQQP